MKKFSKKVLSLILSILILASVCTVMFTANAADTVTIYYRNTKNYSTVNAYYWSSATNSGPLQWPGTAMTALGDNLYSIDVPAGNDMIIFNNGSDQTDDLKIPADKNLFDGAGNSWEAYNPGPKMPRIEVSKKDGASFKSETLDVVITVTDADSASYSVNGGAAKSFVGTATATIGAGVPVNSQITLKVTATNANGTTEKTFTYTKKEAGVVMGDGSTAPALDGYFATNPNSQVGKQATITVDGSVSDWDSSMLIAQGVANDDPRVYRNSSMHEIPIDDYALYAAWDNTNLYLMWEMANVQDAVAPGDDFPLTQGDLKIYNLPIFFYLSIDPEIEGDGTVATGGTVWDSGITLDANIDTVIACSTNGSNGPFIYKANDEGKIVYNDTRLSSIKLAWGKEMVSTELWGIDKAYGEWNNRVPGDALESSSAWVDFYKTGHKQSLDMCYEMSIPLDLLGISASELTANGIGIMKVSTFGTSGMNSLPADPSMWDNATGEYSKDPSSSAEKEDADHITVPLARIGKMGSTNTNPPVNPPVDPPVDSPVTGDTYIVGDADGDKEVSVMDATAIQRSLAQLITITGLARAAADVDVDADVSVLDATAIQRYMAQFVNVYGIGETRTA